MGDAYEQLVKALEDHLELAATNRTVRVRDGITDKPKHVIADAIARLIEEKVEEMVPWR